MSQRRNFGGDRQPLPELSSNPPKELNIHDPNSPHFGGWLFHRTEEELREMRSRRPDPLSLRPRRKEKYDPFPEPTDGIRGTRRSDDEDEEEEEEEEEEEDRKSSVPLHVLRKSQAKRREAERRVQELEERLKALEGDKSDRQKQKFDKLNARMDELYEQIEDARAEGRTKDAAKLQRELDGIRSEMTKAEAAWYATKQAVAQQALAAYNALVAELETIDPRFDQDSDEFDEDLTDRVADLTEAYEARGMNAPEALKKALRTITGVDPFRERPRLAREEKKKVPPRKTDIARNLAAAKKQPPADKAATKERAGEINPLKLSEKEWDELPESTRKKLRGDFIDA